MRPGRRQLFFERADDGWWSMVPYQRLVEFERALKPENLVARKELRNEVVRSISMAEGMTDPERNKMALWLATNDESTMTYRCYRRFPVGEFDLQVSQLDAPYIEAEPDRSDLAS